ncbi:MAG: hypothetical protein ABSA92_11620 [Candidatus Bathyarchaeia archaeon]
MTLCPKCKQAQLILIENNNPELISQLCPTCKYYSSNSEAFASNPNMFSNTGMRIVEELTSYLQTQGLSEQEAQAWLRNEPEFVDTKRSATPLPTKQRRRVTLLSSVYIDVLLEVTEMVS